MGRVRKAKKSPKNAIERGAIADPEAKSNPAADLPKGWGKAEDVLLRVEAVPTCFEDFNRATRVGGIPLGRFIVVHGPTHGGKTAFIGGLIDSFVSQDHDAGYIDAEHATPNEFFEELLGRPLAEVPNFLAKRPASYEETIDSVDEFLNWQTEKRKTNPKHACVLVVDSINKLVPKSELARLRKEGGDAINKGWGRLRAAMNQAWLDHLIPLLASAGCAMIVIAQERDNESDEWGADDFTVKGGKALLFDASFLIRVTKSAAIRKAKATSENFKEETNPTYGFRHNVRIWKSKVSHMDSKYSDCSFHLSNGKLVPAGFDVARDLFYVGTRLGVIETAGSWYSFAKRRWQGEHAAVVKLAESVDLQVQLRTAIRAAAKKSNAAKSKPSVSA